MNSFMTPRIFLPGNLHELLVMYRQNPNALLWAGGTAIGGLRRNEAHYTKAKKIISLSMVNEIARVSRTERYLEIGAGVSYNRILQVGQHVLPSALGQALSMLRPLALRNLATIGGNVAVKGIRLNLFPVLMLLDARVELRSEGRSRWISVQRLFDRSGKMNRESGEVLTRFRIPFEEWDLSYFRQIGSPVRDQRTSLLFCSTGKIVKGMVSDLRFAFGTYSPLIIRNRETEALLTGKKVPFAKKEREEAMELMGKTISESPGISAFQKNRAQEIFRWFVLNLRDPD